MHININEQILITLPNSGKYCVKNVPHEKHNTEKFDDGNFYIHIPAGGRIDKKWLKFGFDRNVTIIAVKTIGNGKVRVLYLFTNCKLNEDKTLNPSLEGRKLSESFEKNDEKSNNVQLVTYSTTCGNLYFPSEDIILSSSDYSNGKRFFNSTSQISFICAKRQIFFREKNVYEIIVNDLQNKNFSNQEELSTIKKHWSLVNYCNRSSEVSIMVKKRANNKCSFCNREVSTNNEDIKNGKCIPELHCHHKVPLSEGGPDIESNCEALCPNCHKWKHIQLKTEDE